MEISPLSIVAEFQNWDTSIQKLQGRMMHKSSRFNCIWAWHAAIQEDSEQIFTFSVTGPSKCVTWHWSDWNFTSVVKMQHKKHTWLTNDQWVLTTLKNSKAGFTSSYSDNLVFIVFAPLIARSKFISVQCRIYTSLILRLIDHNDLVPVLFKRYFALPRTVMIDTCVASSLHFWVRGIYWEIFLFSAC